MIWGKVAGLIFGALFGNIPGALFGLFLGHLLDQNLKHTSIFSSSHFFSGQNEVKQIFFDSTFSVMGCLAKADGRVSEHEIIAAQNIMNQMRLSKDQKERAITQFRLGKQPDFNLQEALAKLKQICGRHPLLLQMFVEIQAQMLSSVGQIAPTQQKLLQQICDQLGVKPLFAQSFFDQTQERYYQSHQQYSGRQRPFKTQTQHSLAQDYALLGIPSSADIKTIKKAYRVLISQHHPDKLVAQGLPEEMIKIATEKTQRIRAAYERICQSRGVNV